MGMSMLVIPKGEANRLAGTGMLEGKKELTKGRSSHIIVKMHACLDDWNLYSRLRFPPF